MPPACRLHTHTHTCKHTQITLLLYPCAVHTHTHTRRRRHTLGFCWNTKHTTSELYLFVFYSRSCYRREDITRRGVVDKIRPVCPTVFILVWKVRSRHVAEGGEGVPAEQTQPEHKRRIFRMPFFKGSNFIISIIYCVFLYFLLLIEHKPT